MELGTRSAEICIKLGVVAVGFGVNIRVFHRLLKSRKLRSRRQDITILAMCLVACIVCTIVCPLDIVFVTVNQVIQSTPCLLLKRKQKDHNCAIYGDDSSAGSLLRHVLFCRLL